jgi:hypothetical protein
MMEDQIEPQRTICSAKYPYLRKNKKGVEACFKTRGDRAIRAYPDVIGEFDLGPKLNSLLEKIMIYRRNNNVDALQKEREKLLTNELVNLIIYDIQTTGVPDIIDDYDDNGEPLGTQHISYPAIIQFSFYHPKTGRHLARYVKPHKPISYEAAKLTGIYNSFSTEFELPMYPEQCDPKSLEDVVMIKYVNQSLLDREEVRENADLFREEQEQNGNKNEDEIGEMAIQKFLEDIENDVNEILSLEDIDAKMLHELADEIFEFISQGESENSKTILLAHNGSRWAEPILRAEMERICSSENLEDYLFIDSKDVYSSIIGELINNELINQQQNNRTIKYNNSNKTKSNVNINDESVKLAALKLGESREESFNTMIDVLNLYSNIEYISETIYGRDDWVFIVSKILEELYKNNQ